MRSAWVVRASRQPERIQNAELKYGVWSDIWSLGLSLVEAGIGKYPYRRFENVFDQLTVIVKEEAPNLPPDRFSQDAIDFITAWCAPSACWRRWRCGSTLT